MKQKTMHFAARYKRIWAAILAMVTLVSVAALGLTGCADEAPVTTPTQINKVTYSVKLLTNAGKPLENVGIFIYADEFKSDLITYARTDSNGTMRFTAKEGSYAAFLNDVPAGYTVQKHYEITQPATDIVLDVAFRQPTTSTVIKLGDVMCEMSVKSTNGQTYTISELLREKRMVMLNFWYLDCPFCIEEFPYLQAAYEKYQDDVAVLAVNPVDKDVNAISHCWKDLGLTFPMAAVDSKWASIMNVQSYPTSIVIDRYGTVCLVTGTAPSAEVFEKIFAYYTADNYSQTVTRNIDDILTSETLIGTAAQPLEIMGEEEFEVTVPAGGKIYCNLYRVFDIIMTLENESATVTMGDTIVTPENGVIATEVRTPNTFEPLLVAFGNTSQQEQTYKVKLSFKEGSHSNPYHLSSGKVSTTVEPGNKEGVYFLYRAEQAGVLSISCTNAPVGVTYEYALHNEMTGSYVNVADTDGAYYIVVNPGDQVRITLSAPSDNQGNSYPGGTFETLAFLEQPVNPQPPEPQPTEPEPTEPEATEPPVEIVLDETPVVL